MVLTGDDRKVLYAASPQLCKAGIPLKILPLLHNVIRNEDCRQAIIDATETKGTSVGMLALLSAYQRFADDLEPLIEALRQEGVRIDLSSNVLEKEDRPLYQKDRLEAAVERLENLYQQGVKGKKKENIVKRCGAKVWRETRKIIGQQSDTGSSEENPSLTGSATLLNAAGNDEFDELRQLIRDAASTLTDQLTQINFLQQQLLDTQRENRATNMQLLSKQEALNQEIQGLTDNATIQQLITEFCSEQSFLIDESNTLLEQDIAHSEAAIQEAQEEGEEQVVKERKKTLIVQHTLPAVFRHQFSVSEFDAYDTSEYYEGPVVLIVHNNITRLFKLCVAPKDSREYYTDFLGVYLWYVDGPEKHLQLNYELSIVTEDGQKYIANAKNKEFVRGTGWGKNNILPRSVAELTEQGYLTQNNTMLDVYVKMSFPEHSPCISLTATSGHSASFGHKFPASEFATALTDQHFDGPLVSIVHGHIPRKFRLRVTPKDSRDKNSDFLGIYLRYEEGPDEILKLKYALFLMTENGLKSIFRASEEVKLGVGRGSNNKLLCSYSALAKEGCLTENNTMLHVFAKVQFARPRRISATSK